MIHIHFSASDPICSTSIGNSSFVIEGHVLKFTCEIKYSGKWAPSMNWYDSVGNTVVSTKLSSMESVVKSELELQIRPEDNNRKLQCLTNFSSAHYHMANRTAATNIPTYNYIHEFSTIIVHCKFHFSNPQIVSTYLNRHRRIRCLVLLISAGRRYIFVFGNFYSAQPWWYDFGVCL